VRPCTSGARKQSMSESPTRAMPMGGKIATRLMSSTLTSGYELPSLGSPRMFNSFGSMATQGEITGGGAECSREIYNLACSAGARDPSDG
jgi:hypothetical protein